MNLRDFREDLGLPARSSLEPEPPAAETGFAATLQVGPLVLLGGAARSLPPGAWRSRDLDVAEAEALPVRQVLVGSLACLRAGLGSCGSTVFDAPGRARLPVEELRRWSRVLQAGMVAERLVYGETARGGADDRALLGQIWGLSGFDVETAQREQRQARREVERLLRERRQALEQRAELLLAAAPRLGLPLAQPGR